MYPKATVKIESRVHLLSTLAEAAELEHNLMCMYLYSLFSLKTISFALERYITPSELTSEKLLLAERVDEILYEVQALRSELEDQTASKRKHGGEFARSLDSVENILRNLRESLSTLS